ncbi:MAG: sugar phosphate isomerase/epimerase family protein [Lachnospiraceae bacterium]
MSYNIKRSISLYSYQQEYYDGRLDLEGCIREAAKTGATGIELLPEQMMDSFPVVTPEFRETWFGLMDKYHTEPTCSDAFLENKIYDNRTLTLREQIDMMNRDIKIAGDLGFKTLRTLVSTPMNVIEGSLGCAQENDVKVCIEVHSPFSLNSGWADGYMEMILRTGTKYFGFMPDFGIFCRSIPDIKREQAFRFGATREGVKIVDDAFASRVEKGIQKIRYDLNLGAAHHDYMVANGLPELMVSLKKANCNQADFNYAMGSYEFSWNDPKDIIDNIDYIYHTHAKCYNLTADYVETSMPLPEIVQAYKTAGYKGYLSTEYEGNRMQNDALEVDSVEQVRRHQEALRREIEKG